jgi:hypothetical protein
MMPVEKPKEAPKTDMYPLFPLVEEGNWVKGDNSRKGRRRRGTTAVPYDPQENKTHMEHLGPNSLLP